MKKNNAQSILEIVAMILFIGATIFIGGPTIIRGVNAHFKLWDDSVQDSYNDPLKQAPVQNLPSDCVCDPPMGGPGLRCGIPPCLPTERLETVLCNPVGCGAALGFPESYCVDGPTCCDIYLDTNLCGLGGAPPDCPVGERITQRACGGGTSNFGCRVDTNPTAIDGNPTCIPHCIGAFNANEAEAAGNPTVPIICPGDDTSVAGALIQYIGGVGLPITLLGRSIAVCSHPPSPPPDNKCETYCLPQYIPSGTGCIPNTCPSTFQVATVTPGGTTNASYSRCELFPIGIANMVGGGCSNPGVPGNICTLNLIPLGSEGFLYCKIEFIVAGVIANSPNNQSFTRCESYVLSTATAVGPGCGNPGTPSTTCLLEIH